MLGRLVLVVLAAVALLTALGGAGLQPEPASAAVPPVVMTDVCVTGGQGQLSFPIGGTCAGKPSFPVDDPAQILPTCYLLSNGGIRKATGASQCTAAPRSKKEAFLLVPSLTTDLYFCANNTSGRLFFITSPIACPSGHFQVVVEQANHPPVSNSQSVSLNEDASLLITLSASDSDDQNLSFSIVAGQGPSHGSLGAIGAPDCAAVSTCTATVTYTPTANYFGPDSFKFRTNDGFANSADATVSITVDPVNDVPSFVKGADQTVDEDSGPSTVSPWATSISPGPANESGQTVSFTVTGNTNAGLFAAGPAVASDGTLTFTPAANANGEATITLKAVDDGVPPAESATQSFKITVTPVNDVPGFVKGADQTVGEDSAPSTVFPWATAISPGPADESGQSVSFTATSDNPSLFSVAPAVAPDGALSFTPAPNANGEATITLKAVDNGSPPAESAEQSFKITVTPVNDAPVFVAGVDQTVGEDSGPSTVSPWATSISPGPANESGQTVSFTVTGNTNAGLFAAGPAVASDGTLTFTPAANANGEATITLKAVDNGVPPAESATQSFKITVTPVNDVPGFVKGADQTVGEDSGAQIVSPWATAISPGPADESGQSVSFTVTGNTNAGLFAAGPAVASDGTLTFTPAANANGEATITLKAVDDGVPPAESATQSFKITVTPVNDVPSFVKGADQTVDEDSGPHTVSPWATSLSPGPADESGQALEFIVVSNSNEALFAGVPGQPFVSPAGDLSFTPALNANGSAVITIKVKDDGTPPAESATQQFTITVDPVNDVPGFVKGADQTVGEDAGAQTVSPWATAIGPGPADEAGQSVSFSITGNTNTGLFSAGPAVSPAGVLTYTPAANANGEATITLKAVDNGVPPAESATQSFKITVTPVNDEPSFDLPASPDQTVVQDSGPQTVAAFATNISAGPADESGQTLTFDVSNDDNSLFSAQPDIDETTGDLTYTPAAGATGSATVSVFLTDNGGTAGGGDDTSATQTFDITVSPPNATPVAVGGAVAVTEDTLKTITLTATDADDDDLTFAIVTGPSNGSLGSIGPVDCTGVNTCTTTVDYTPGLNFDGADSFTFKANDGTIDSAPATVAISVAPVNDAPVIDSTAPTTATEDLPYAYNATRTDPDGPGQTWSLLGTHTCGGSIVPATGAYTFTPTGPVPPPSCVVAINVCDGGSPDQCDTQTTTVTITAVNDAPVIDSAAPTTATEDLPYAYNASRTDPDGPGQTWSLAPADTCGGSIVAATGVYTFTPTGPVPPPSCVVAIKVCDGGSPDQCDTQTTTVTITAVNDAPTANGFSNLPAQAGIPITYPAAKLGGTDPEGAAVTIDTTPTAVTNGTLTISPDGSFTFTPSPSAASGSFQYRVSDNGSPLPSLNSPYVTVSFTVAGPAIYFVKNPAVGSGNCTLGNECTLATALGSISATPNARIFIGDSAVHAAAVPLNSGGWLIGQGVSGTTFDTLFGIGAPVQGTLAARPALGLPSPTVLNTVTLNTGSVVRGLNLSTGASTGMNDPAGAISGVSVSESSVTTTTGTGVDLSNIVGTLSLTGLTTSGGAGANLIGANAGSTFSFAGVSVSSGANSAFTATGGGTVNVTGAANTLATTTGTALNVANTTIGAGGLTFRSIASNGAANGIVLNNTGSGGGLTVTGTGGAGTGGTIQSSTGPGVSLTSTSGVSLTGMTISNGQDDGIRGTSVTGLTIASSTVSNNGNAVTERGIEVTNLLGTASITGSTLTSSADDNLYVVNDVATPLTLTVSGGTISETDAVTGGDGVIVIANGTSNITASVTGVAFTNQRSDHIQLTTDAVSAATLNATIDGNTMTSTNPALVLGGGITVNPSGTATITAVIRNHATFTGAVTSAISVASSSSSTVRATITSNTIGNAAVNGSGSSQGNGIYFSRTNSSSIFASITNNSIRQWTNLSGIDLNSGDGTGGGLHATVTGNTLSNPASGASPLHGVHLNSGTTAGNNQVNCLDLRTNTLTGSGVAGNGGFDVRLRQRFLTTVRLPGYGGANSDNAAVAAFVQGNNAGPPTVSASNNVAGGGFGFVNGACTLP